MNLFSHRLYQLVFASLLFLSASSQAAKVDSILLDADTMTRDLGKGMIYLNGNVKVIFKGYNIWCDQATINTKTKTVDAVGNMSMQSTQMRATGSRAVFNYENSTGMLYDGYVEVGQVAFEGKLIYKTGEKDFTAIEGTYTTCTTCPPAWKFDSSKITATLGGYAHIKNSVLYLGKLPVFWLPYLIVPVSSRRQTGFLFPEIKYGAASKFIYEQAFFWAMSDSTDSTWTLVRSEGRGEKGLLNYRYMLTESSFGELDYGYGRDKAFTGDMRRLCYVKDRDPEYTGDINKDCILPQEGPTQNRSFFKYKHYFDLPDGYVQRAQINHATDTWYPKDFPNEMGGYAEAALDNRVSLTKNTESQSFLVEADYYRNLLIHNPLGDNSSAVHRFPTAKYSMAPQKIMGSLLFQVDSDYLNLSRDGKTFDKVTRAADGSPSVDTISASSGTRANTYYDAANDVIRTGQRLNVEPRLSYPVQIGPYLDLLPGISYRESKYDFGLPDPYSSAYRRFFRDTLSIRTQFGGIYGDEEGSATRYKHEVQPEIVYTSTPWYDQSNHPFFGTNEPFSSRDQGISNADVPQFDYDDRLYDRHLATFVLNNYLIRRGCCNDEGLANYNQIATLRLTQSYDIYKHYQSLARGVAREPFSDLSGLLDIRLPRFDTNTVARYYFYDKITSISSRARILDSFGNFAQASYSQDFQLSKPSVLVTASPEPVYNTVSTINSYSQSLQIDLGNKSRYVTFRGGLSYDVLSRTWTQYQYAVDLIPPGDCWSFSFSEVRPIRDQWGEPIYAMSINFNYGNGVKSLGSDAFVSKW